MTRQSVLRDNLGASRGYTEEKASVKSIQNGGRGKRCLFSLLTGLLTFEMITSLHLWVNVTVSVDTSSLSHSSQISLVCFTSLWLTRYFQAAY